MANSSAARSMAHSAQNHNSAASCMAKSQHDSSMTKRLSDPSWVTTPRPAAWHKYTHTKKDHTRKPAHIHILPRVQLVFPGPLDATGCFWSLCISALRCFTLPPRASNVRMNTFLTCVCLEKEICRWTYIYRHMYDLFGCLPNCMHAVCVYIFGSSTLIPMTI